jgi:DNA-binding XRE family transcriptional regulator
VHPFCHLVIKAMRYDSPPWINSGQSFCKLLLEKRLTGNLTQEELAEQLNVSLRTPKNWERGWTLPNLKFWLRVRSFLNEFTQQQPNNRFQTAFIANKKAQDLCHPIASAPVANRLYDAFLGDRLKGAVSCDRIAGYFQSRLPSLAAQEFNAIRQVCIICNTEGNSADVHAIRQATA